MLLFVLKFAITLFVVIGLSEIAKRINPNFAGILLGLPLGAGISGYFFTYEQGVPFMLAAIPWAVAGLSSSILFSLAYVMAGKLVRPTNRVLAVAAASVLSAAAFLLFSLGLRHLEITLPTSFLLSASVIVLNMIIFSRLEIKKGGVASRPMGIGVLLFRAVTAGLTITVITGTAGIIGPGWSGILSAFPVMLFPLLLVLHYEEDDRLYPGVVHGYAYSVTNLLLFYILLHLLLPRLGLNLTYVVVYIVSALYLWQLNRLRSGNMRK